jgi:hypothetical protein
MILSNLEYRIPSLVPDSSLNNGLVETPSFGGTPVQ